MREFVMGLPPSHSTVELSILITFDASHDQFVTKTAHDSIWEKMMRKPLSGSIPLPRFIRWTMVWYAGHLSAAFVRLVSITQRKVADFEDDISSW